MIPIARLWHKKGKLEYHCILQMLKYFPDVEFEWHIVLDKYDYRDEWSDKIDSLPINITWYSTKDMLDYAKACDYIDDNVLKNIPNFVHFYHIIIFHYLRRVLRYDYALAYEYDIIFNSYELDELKECIVNKIPFGIFEPSNPYCDKALYKPLSNLFRTDILANSNYKNMGFNAGFQGMNLKLFDNFLNPDIFKELVKCFDLSGIYNEDGSEKIDFARTLVDTQEQSFHSLMNRAVSWNFKLLNPQEYYFVPYYVDIDVFLKSKVVHYFSHIKPEIMIKTIEQRLLEWDK